MIGPPKNSNGTPVGPELSAVEALEDNLERLVSDVDSLKRELKELSQPNLELNTIYR